MWGRSCQSYINALVKLQKRAIRIISGVHPRTHTDPLFTELKLLKCDEIHKYLVGRLMYRIYNEDITLFDSMFMKNEQVCNYDTPFPWASVHWLIQCTLECHWNSTGWPSVHWDTTGRPTEYLQGTLGHHWKNLVETAPHWNATGET